MGLITLLKIICDSPGCGGVCGPDRNGDFHPFWMLGNNIDNEVVACKFNGPEDIEDYFGDELPVSDNSVYADTPECAIALLKDKLINLKGVSK